MRWPQITMMIIFGFNVGAALAKHGQPRDGTYNVFVILFGTVMEAAILYAGGFFND